MHHPERGCRTGPPLENKLEELISIVQFVDQHRLGPTWTLLHEHQVKDEFGRVTGYTGLEKIGQTLAPILIRRRRSEVLTQLPSRNDQNLLVPMTEMQLVHHRENADIVAQIVKRWRRTKFLSDKDQRRLTCALQNMRMSCNSTYLLDQETDYGVKADELAALLDGIFVQPDAKAVVFSQWTRTQDIVIRRLEDRGIGYVSFHGGVPAEKRPALVERFRADPHCRVFLSTDAGAAGLNLQHASTLVNMDLPWNPIPWCCDPTFKTVFDARRPPGSRSGTNGSAMGVVGKEPTGTACTKAPIPPAQAGRRSR